MSNEGRKAPTPEGFGSWLEYAVATFDTRSAQLPFLFDFDDNSPITRDEIHATIWAEYNELRTNANLPQIDPTTRRCIAEAADTPTVLGLNGLIARPANPISLEMMGQAISHEASKGHSFDVSSHLDDEEIISAYLSAALEDQNPGAFLLASGNVAKAQSMFKPLDREKAAPVNPLGNSDDYGAGPYVTPGTTVAVKIESREQELSILAAYDYGFDALSTEGKHQIDRLISDLKVAITGR